MWPDFDHEWTVGDVLAAQGNSLVRIELLRGVPLLSPLARVRHQHVAGSLAGRLAGLATAMELDLMVFRSVNVRQGEHDLLQPDIAVVTRTAGLSRLADDAVAFAPEEVALVVEVLSAGHEGSDRIDKFERYAEWAIPGYWIVDPARPVVETYTLSDGDYVVSGVAEAGTVATLAAFAPVTLDPAELLRIG